MALFCSTAQYADRSRHHSDLIIITLQEVWGATSASSYSQLLNIALAVLSPLCAAATLYLLSISYYLSNLPVSVFNSSV